MVVRSRRLKRACHVVRMGEYRSAFRILTVKPTGDHWEGLGVDGRRTLE